MSEEKKGIATVGGNPITLIGPELKVGDKAPDFTVNKDLMEEKSLSDYAGKIKLISVVPSLDTKVCEAQTRRFNEEATKFGDGVAVLTISVDLPFAQDRFCSVAGIDNLDTLSDYKTHAFGKNYGVLIKELQLDMRSIFIIDQENTIRYVQYVKEMTDHPDYEAALNALRALV
ncbi:thiol peroxidase [Sporolactobacillus terrae]|uniref:Thiol peroxidase n=1 Tax=Sporolactobacillus terrae TaxID=269673 RepID=A0A410D9K2_9BACL|nr:thiol peroxidase [Sporolactobacillus terrae]QAA22773.1 thiol peroxidase [Sporolactobacillus terrae]QAA25746.1 thiol peroxidase [Sporolactobacillus terrae]UAK17936.1 thiol peroxidase [Sporolactobacillus terrae]BBN99109.1 putative thiol peroxidase [Sporolactobacillus terrae]